MESYEELEKRLTDPLKPKGFPIGIKLLKEEEELEEYVCVRPHKNIALCQLLGLARLRGRPMGATAEEIDGCVFGTRILGLKELPEDMLDGSRWKELAKIDPSVMEKLFEGVHKFDLGEYAAIIATPLRHFDMLETDPDVIMVYGIPSKIWLLTVAYHDMTGKRLKVDFCGHGACEAIVATVETGEPWVTIPCGGAIGLCAIGSDELFMTFKVEHLKIMLDRIEKARMRCPAGGLYEMLVVSPVEGEYITNMVGRKTPE